jgi:DNA-binding NarL/FixJ family response regulator
VNISVALLDDHEVVLEGLARMLERYGFSVVVATGDAARFVELVRRERPDLCVVDLRLGPGQSGIDVTRSVMSSAAGTKVAILTSSEDGALAAEAVQAGASGFIIKDSSASHLAERLAAVARGDVVIDRRVASGVLAAQGPSPAALTAQEVRLLGLVAEGMTNQEIARQLSLSPHTVKEYLGKAMRKLGTRSRAETVAKALANGLLG